MATVVPLLALLVAAAPIAEQRLGRAVCRMELSSTQVALSGELQLTLTIEGPAPVEVEVPRPLTRSPDWRVTAQPPKTTPLAEQRERWQQTFRLEPFQTGEVSLPLQSLRFRTGNEVRDWGVTWPPAVIRVTTSVGEVELGSAKPLPDIERLPPVEDSFPRVWMALAVLVLVVVLALMAGRRRRRRDLGREQTPRERALAELARLDADGGLPPAQLPQLADVLRRFLEEQFQLAATRQTTAEFEATLRSADILSAAEIDLVTHILARCDLVKFAGVLPSPETCQQLRRQTRDLIAASSDSANSEPVETDESLR